MSTFWDILTMGKHEERKRTFFLRVCISCLVLSLPMIIKALFFSEPENTIAASGSIVGLFVCMMVAKYSRLTLGVLLAAIFFYPICSLAPLYIEDIKSTLVGLIAIFMVIAYTSDNRLLSVLNLFLLVVGFMLHLYLLQLDISFPFKSTLLAEGLIGTTFLVMIFLTFFYYQRDIYELQKKYETNNRFLNQLSDLNPNYIFAKDLDRRFTFVNQSLANKVGLPKDSFLHKKDSELPYLANGEDPFKKEDDEVLLKGKKVFQKAHQFITREGNIRWIETVKTPISNGGKIEGLLGVSTDVTERYNTTVELEQSKSLYQALFENLFEAVVVYDYKEEQFTDCNQSALSMFQLEDKEDLKRRPYQDFMPEYDPKFKYSPEELYLENKLHIEQGKKYTFNGKLKRLNGEEFEAKLSYIPTGRTPYEAFAVIQDVYNEVKAKRALKEREEHFRKIVEYSPIGIAIRDYEQNRLISVKNKVYILGFIQDIDENLKKEAALRESERRYRTLFEESPMGIIIVDLDDKKKGLECNQRWAEKLDLNKQQTLNGNMLTFSPKYQDDQTSSKDKLHEVLEAYRNTRKTLTFDWKFQKPNQEVFWAEVLITPIHWKGREETMMIVRDITQQKKQRKIIKENIKALNQTNEELKRYIESNMQLENFAYLASHDLKNPLISIIHFSKILQKKLASNISEQDMEMIQLIFQSSQNMKQLIDDLLTYSLVDTQNLHIDLVNLKELVELTLKELHSKIVEKKAQIKIIAIPEVISADITQMRQLFQNLISNAIKFAKPDQPPVIEIDYKDAPEAWKFYIKDNGIGIQPEFQEKIFLLFRKLHYNSAYEGTGIGLALCKKIVEQHGGEISLESEFGKGTTFFFSISKWN